MSYKWEGAHEEDALAAARSVDDQLTARFYREQCPTFRQRLAEWIAGVRVVLRSLGAR